MITATRGSSNTLTRHREKEADVELFSLLPSPFSSSFSFEIFQSSLLLLLLLLLLFVHIE